MLAKNKLVFIGQLVVNILFFLMLSAAYAGQPLWTIAPAAGSFPSQVIPRNGTTAVQYIVQNKSILPKHLVIMPAAGVTQTSDCLLTPRGQFGSSCVINLAINGSTAPSSGIHGGPIVCQAFPNGSNIPNSNQCYRPSASDSLNITISSPIPPPPPTGAQITVTPTNLMFGAGNSGMVTVTNSNTSTEAANNVLASIPGSSGISVQNTTCSASLAIGASCTIMFTAAAAEGPTAINISGNNTNIVNIQVTVTSTTAILNITPTNLIFAQNSTGDVTVTNDPGSPVPAINVIATIPGGSNISVQNTTCGALLAIGASCVITFTSAVQEGPTTIPIAGTNTNIVNVDITVTAQPVISITGPIQQSRVVPVGGSALNLQITNSNASVINADSITVSNKASCPDLVVDDSNCMSVAPGGSCTLALTSPSPYEPCTITVSGSNTANSPTSLIAFFYLGGLVFEESGGTGKIVIDVGQEFSDQLWNDFNVDIPGTNANDGETNTDIIFASVSCQAAANDCAAWRCRSWGSEWFLPATNELLLIHSTLCGNSATPCNFGQFSSADPYWTSTQTPADSTRADAISFPTAFNFPSVKNAGAVYFARCARAF